MNRGRAMANHSGALVATRAVRRLTWVTDPHLDHASRAHTLRFVESLAAAEGDAVLLTGDIGTARTIERWLVHMRDAVRKPIYFVLGNHDFYGSGTVQVRGAVSRLCAESAGLTYLWDSSAIALSDKTALVGVDGWGDARYGNWSTTDVNLSDFRLIDDLVWSNVRPLVIEKLRGFGDDSSHRLRTTLASALATHETVIVATHVPPFAEAAWHEGKRSEDDWVPYFACKAVGDVLLEAAEANPHRHLLVLCGHTHGAGEVRMRPNLQVITGGAVYGQPEIQRTLEIA